MKRKNFLQLGVALATLVFLNSCQKKGRIPYAIAPRTILSSIPPFSPPGLIARGD